MKEIIVTGYFMELDEDTRKCQNFETQDDCKTRLYIERLRKECGCLPLFLRLSGKVNLIIYFKRDFQYIYHILRRTLFA